MNPWPDSLLGLGPRKPLADNGVCVRCTFPALVAYGEHPLCLGCAQWLETPTASYVAVLRRLCHLILSADLNAIQEALREQGGLAAALGDVLASAIGAKTDEEWHAETGICPGCGERGPLHRRVET